MLAIELSIRFSGDRPVGGYRAAAVLPYGTASFQVDVVVARKWLQSVLLQALSMRLYFIDQSASFNSQANFTTLTTKQEQSSLLV
jgi:hypothetical protein